MKNHLRQVKFTD